MFEKILEKLFYFIKNTSCLGITQTTFSTVDVNQTLKIGKPIGEGKCKAVRLHLNQFVKDDTTSTLIANTQVYFGDENSQNYELLRGAESHIIVTDRLEKIFVRNPFPTVAYIQVEIMN